MYDTHEDTLLRIPQDDHLSDISGSLGPKT